MLKRQTVKIKEQQKNILKIVSSPLWIQIIKFTQFKSDYKCDAQILRIQGHQLNINIFLNVFFFKYFFLLSPSNLYCKLNYCLSLYKLIYCAFCLDRDVEAKTNHERRMC